MFSLSTHISFQSLETRITAPHPTHFSLLPTDACPPPPAPPRLPVFWPLAGRRAEATSIMRAAMNIAVSPPKRSSSSAYDALGQRSAASRGPTAAGRDEVGITVTTTVTSSRATPNPPQASPPVGDVLLDDKAAPKNSPADSLVSGWAYGSGGSGVGSGAGGTGTAAPAIGTTAAAVVAAAATASAAGLNAETATVASASANASALAAGAKTGGTSTGAATANTMAIASRKEEQEQEEKARAEEREDGRDWELAHSVAVASLNNLAVLLSEQGKLGFCGEGEGGGGKGLEGWLGRKRRGSNQSLNVVELCVQISVSAPFFTGCGRYVLLFRPGYSSTTTLIR